MSMANRVNAPRAGDYLEVLRRQWLPICIGLVLGIGSALAYVHWVPKEYQATTSVLVTPSGGSTQTAQDKDPINMDTELALVSSTGTVSAVADRLGISSSGEGALARRLSVDVPPNTNVLDISYTGTTGADAQRGAAAFAQAYLDRRGEVEATRLRAEADVVQSRIDAVNAQLQPVLQAQAALRPTSPDRPGLAAQVAVLSHQLSAFTEQQGEIRTAVISPGEITRQAAVPLSPSSPDPLVALITGIVLGLLAGGAVALSRHRADDVIRSPEDLFRRTGVHVATVLSGRLDAEQVKILPPTDPDGRRYARLRNLVTGGLLPGNRPVVLVAGIRHGGGPVAANLAASLATAGEDVYLLCADVFASTSAGLLCRNPQPGLSKVLAGEVEVTDVAETVPGIPTLRTLGVARDPAPADRHSLQTRSPRRLVDQLLDSGAYVVVEAPSTYDSPDAQTLANVANVAELGILVVELDRTRASEVVDACAQLEATGTPVFGAVLARYGKDSDLVVDAEDAVVPKDDATARQGAEPAVYEWTTGSQARRETTVGAELMQRTPRGSAPR